MGLPSGAAEHFLCRRRCQGILGGRPHSNWAPFYSLRCKIREAESYSFHTCRSLPRSQISCSGGTVNYGVQCPSDLESKSCSYHALPKGLIAPAAESASEVLSKTWLARRVDVKQKMTPKQGQRNRTPNPQTQNSLKPNPILDLKFLHQKPSNPYAPLK